jgi:hypothetical protein
MWVKRNPEEIKKDKNREERKLFLLFFLLVFIPALLIEKFALWKWVYFNKIPSVYPSSKDWNEMFNLIPNYLAISAGVSFFFTKYIINSQLNNVICLKCGSAKNRDSVLLCKCGGSFEVLNSVEWIESK